MFEFKFTTKDEYLQQKKVWFFLYKDQIKKIRKCKQEIKVMQRSYVSNWPKSVGELNTAIGALYSAREEMGNLLRIRHEARLEAGRQYNAQKRHTIA